MRASSCLGVVLSLWSAQAFGQVLGTPEELLRRQTEQIQDIKSRNDPQAEVRSQPAPASGVRRLPVESPCLVINEVALRGFRADAYIPALSGEDLDDPPQGRCIGTQGVQILIHRIQSALVEDGFITARVQAPDQDLKSATLTLEIVPGLIGEVRVQASEDAAPLKSSAYAFTAGAVLNLREVEQTVENIRRMSGADLKVEIVPGQVPGTSDLLLSFTPPRPIRAQLDVDDAGSRSTGRLQGNLALHWSHPLRRADTLYLNVGGDLGDRSPGPRGSDNHLLHYSIPLGHWLVQGSVNRSRYDQQVAGAFQNYRYHGSSGEARLKVERVVHRSAVARSSLSLEAFARRSQSYIDDTEVLVQRRRTGGWELAAQHTLYRPSSTWELDYRYRRGTGAFGSIAAPEELFGEGTSRMRTSWLQLRYQSTVPWLEIQGTVPAVSSLWRGQWAHTPVTSQDRLCFGGRHTVRGFDGALSMCGDSGWFVRNEISWAVPSTPVQLYVGADGGKARGASAAPSSWLLGWVAGVRATLRSQSPGQVHLDTFVGAPIRRPSWLPTSHHTSGFSLQVQF